MLLIKLDCQRLEVPLCIEAYHYEILKYKTMHNHPLPEGESLQDTALYGMELCPDYFGTYPVPPQTPWGRTLRHRPLDNGIYWMETDVSAGAIL